VSSSKPGLVVEALKPQEGLVELEPKPLDRQDHHYRVGPLMAAYTVVAAEAAILVEVQGLTKTKQWLEAEADLALWHHRLLWGQRTLVTEDSLQGQTTLTIQQVLFQAFPQSDMVGYKDNTVVMDTW
jgi:hypothetical protein